MLAWEGRKTYYVVQSFSNVGGRVQMDPPVQVRTEESARRMAERLAQRKASVIVLARTGDPSLGDFDEPVVLVSYGGEDELPF